MSGHRQSALWHVIDRLGLETERREAGGGGTVVGRGGWGATCYMFLFLLLRTVPIRMH